MPGVNGIELQPHEAFVLSRFDNGQLTIGQLVALGGLSQTASMHAVYCLLDRRISYPATAAILRFQSTGYHSLRAANFQLKKATQKRLRSVAEKGAGGSSQPDCPRSSPN